MKAYKFLKNDMRSGYGDESSWQVGEEREIKGRLALCLRGYHSSPSWYDALSYAQGNMACVVDVSKSVEKKDNKQVSHKCRIIQCVSAEKILRAWGCDCTERALKRANVQDTRSWNAIKVVRLFNEGKVTSQKLAAAWAAAWDAARDAARDAAWAAARAAASDAAWDAAWTAAWAAASDAEIKWQKKHLNKLMDRALNP